MPSMVRICIGVGIIVGTFLLGMIMMIGAIRTGTFDVVMILVYTLGLPMLGLLMAMPLLCTGVRQGITPSSVGTVQVRYVPPPTQSQPVAAASYVYEPPTVCPDCGGKLTSSNIEWVGPLTVKCPYCGSSVPAVKRQV
jgi:hypothetical protein